MKNKLMLLSFISLFFGIGYASSDTVKVIEIHHDTLTKTIQQTINPHSTGKTISDLVVILSGITAGTISMVDASARNNSWWAQSGYYNIQLTLSIGLIAIGISNLFR